MSTRSRRGSSTSTSETCDARSRPSPHVLITSSLCRASATASPTPARPSRGDIDTELGQRLDDEIALSEARVRNDEVSLAQAPIPEQQDVDVDHPRSPATRPPPTALTLDRLGDPQQRPRRAAPLPLHDLVQESRLLGHAPRFCLHDAALPQDTHSSLTQPPAGRAQVARARPQVGTKAEIHDRHLMRSATRTARVIWSTSCTRTMSAPLSTAATTVAVVPSSRSVTGRSNSLPMNDLRDVPTRMGCPSSRSSVKRRITSQFWSAVLPKPMPGSRITFSPGTPAATAREAALERKPLISSIRSRAYSVPSWLCMSTSAQPRSAAMPAIAGARVRPQTSLRIVAPAATPDSATSRL